MGLDNLQVHCLQQPACALVAKYACNGPRTKLAAAHDARGRYVERSTSSKAYGSFNPSDFQQCLPSRNSTISDGLPNRHKTSENVMTPPVGFTACWTLYAMLLVKSCCISQQRTHTCCTHCCFSGLPVCIHSCESSSATS